VARGQLRTAERLHDIAQARAPQHGRVSSLRDRALEELASPLGWLPSWSW
jgi:hypothetical protein